MLLKFITLFHYYIVSLVKCKPDTNGMIIPGSEQNTDILSTSISFAKNKLKSQFKAIAVP